MATEISSTAEFRKASYSTHGNCVEVAYLDGGRAAVRDSKDRGAGPVLVFTNEEWVAFLSGVRSGEFDFGLLSA